MRLKDLGYLYSGLTGKAGEDFAIEDPAQGKPFVPFTNIFNNFRVDVDNVRLVAMTKGEVQNRVETGDILFLMSSEDYESIGKPSVVSDKVGELYLNSFCRGLRITRSEVCPDYVAYYLSAESVRQLLRLEARGFTRINLKIDRLASQEVLLPKLSVQRQIVAYLDEKAAAIDARVAVLEKKLAAYRRLKTSVINQAVTRGLDPKAEMKDSGVDWIGKIPAGWEARNLTQCCDFFKGLAITKADLTESGTPVISYGQIHSKLNIGTHLRPELLRHVPEAIAAADPGSRLKVGDIVFADTSEDVEGCGNCVLIDAEFPVYAGYHAIVARPDESGRSRYLSYLFNAPRWRAQIRAKVAGIKVFSITQRIFKGVSLLLPSVADANAIADYLDAECAKIDKVAGLVTREIELYRKLKRSLINEVVTGKRKVA